MVLNLHPRLLLKRMIKKKVKILYASLLIRVQQAKEEIKSFTGHHTRIPLLGPRNGTGSDVLELLRFAIHFRENSEHTKKRLILTS